MDLASKVKTQNYFFWVMFYFFCSYLLFWGLTRASRGLSKTKKIRRKNVEQQTRMMRQCHRILKIFLLCSLFA
jgi:hypothetical protein